MLKKGPLVSVLVPARNEEKNIGRCLRSLSKQDYHNIEILVLDDNSSDDTARIVEKLSEKDKRIRLVRGRSLSRGWKGKSYACHQLSREASGEYYVFTDADTLHFPNSISSSLRALLSGRLDALSVFPKQIMVSVHERMVVIFINLAVLALMPLGLIRKTRSPKISIANGQFMLFKRSVYRSIGGHRSIKNDIVEDVAISKQVKKCGYRFMVFDGRSAIYCRMYDGFKGVVRGFSKFIFAAMNYSVIKLGVVVSFIMLLFLVPLLLLPFGLYFFNWPLLINVMILSQVSIILLIRIAMTFRFKSRFTDIFLHPLSMFYIAVLSVNSVYQAKYGNGIFWKDRFYGIAGEDDLDNKKVK
ncbi:MAG: glycosyltransferase, partial [Candidatus Humimicrobiaceae bacterium]